MFDNVKCQVAMIKSTLLISYLPRCRSLCPAAVHGPFVAHAVCYWVVPLSTVLHCSVCDWLKTSTLGPGLRHDKIRNAANLVGYYSVFSGISHTDIGISIGFKVSVTALSSVFQNTDACYYTRSFTYLTSSEY